MTVCHIRVWFLVAGCVLLAACSNEKPAAPRAPRTIAMTRVARVPLGSAAQAGNAQTDDLSSLAVFPGSADELPTGPSGFDVDDDGNFLIADPLRNRIAKFDRNGVYRSEWQIGFAADSVTALAGGMFRAREANTGQLHLFDSQGKPVDGRSEEGETMEARLTGSGGVVTWAAASGRSAGSIEVHFSKEGARLLSIEAIPMASSQNGPSQDIYVALESSAGGDVVDLSKTVRRYSPDGTLVAETTELPLEYYIRPADEIRVHKGVVYQLMTTSSETQINAWDTN